MVERTLALKNASGLHARPASLLVQTVNKFPGTDVKVAKGEREVSARSLLSVLSLGVGAGDSVTFRCDGPQESEAMAALESLVEGGFGE